MDGGPYRPQRPVDRRVASRPASPQRQPEELEIVDDEPPKTSYRPVPTHQSPKKPSPLKKFGIPAAIVIGVLLVAGIAWFLVSQSQKGSAAPEIDSSKYQAVFFTNGQVYFGKLKASNSDYMNMTDIFYLQNQSAQATDAKNPQETSSDQNGVQLIKLGDEIHGPEDKMIISKDQVLFYENLKTDGKVAKSIEEYKASK
jgi:hypothetical protein